VQLATLHRPSDLGLLSPDMVDEWQVVEHFKGSLLADVQLLRNASNDPVFGKSLL